MKPMIVIPPETMSKEDIATLRENGICVVEAKDTEKVRFVDPISSAEDRPASERAAIAMSRILLNGCWGDYDTCSTIGRSVFARIFVDCLIKGTPLDRNYQSDEEIKRIARTNELRRIACEEARDERAAAKAAKAAAEKSKEKKTT